MMYLIYLSVGAIGGLLVGLIGGGIGPIVVPTLIFTLNSTGVNHDAAVHLAVGTSLAIVLITTTVSILGFHRGQLIRWPLLKLLLPGTVIGAIAGSAGSALLSGKVLQGVFGFFLIIVGMITMKMKKGISKNRTNKELEFGWNLFLSSLLLSACSTILGVSDGLLLVPYLCRYNIPMRDTIATATVCAFSASLMGTIPYMLIGLHAINLPNHCFGYIYLPAFAAIAFASCAFTNIGVYLNRVLPEEKLKNVFVFFLIVIGLKMVFI